MLSLESRLIERFMRYTSIASQSDASKIGKCLPTSPGQKELANMLAKELLANGGLDDVICDDFAIVTAVKRGNKPNCPRLGFIAHLDTYDAGLSPIVRAQKLHYSGGDICLNKEKDIWLREGERPEIKKYAGQDILFSDGTSVLGADDKAAISVIMEMITSLTPQDEHGDIIVCFVPDEEIGLLGAKQLNIKERFNVDFAYTIDCCELGEVVYETFNAASATIRFTGITAHPMAAKGVLVNPLLMAMDYIACFDRKETPECTEGREGYYWFSNIEGNTNEAALHAMIREHDLKRYTERKEKMYQVAKEIQARYPKGKVQIKIEDVYSNIANCIGDDRTAIDLLIRALKASNVKPNIIPMRGGTDGAALSTKGLLTPNYFTGAHNFHSRFEFLPIPSFIKSFEVTRQIVLLAAKIQKNHKSSL